MKKELIELKELTAEFSKVKKEFDNEREMFNLAVEESDTRKKLYSYAEDEMDDAYVMALNFVDNNQTFISEAEKLKREHPRYGEKRFISTVVTNVLDRYGVNDDAILNVALESAEIYVMLEKAGFNSVKAKEDKLTEIAGRINDSANLVVNQTGEAIVGAGKKVVTTVGNVARPYGEIAKEQLGVAGEKAKGLVNKGSKKLVKLFEKIDEKTSK